MITVAVVDSGMLVLGFRQFLLIPPPDGSGNLDPTDRYGRFVAMYMGMNQTDVLTTPAPIRQGMISCPSATGRPRLRSPVPERWSCTNETHVRGSPAERGGNMILEAVLFIPFCCC